MPSRIRKIPVKGGTKSKTVKKKVPVKTVTKEELEDLLNKDLENSYLNIDTNESSENKPLQEIEEVIKDGFDKTAEIINETVKEKQKQKQKEKKNTNLFQKMKGIIWF